MKIIDDDLEYLFMLILFDYLTLVYRLIVHGRGKNERSISVIVIDNIDSLNNPVEEIKLISTIKSVAKACADFISDNIDNDVTYELVDSNATDKNRIINSIRINDFFKNTTIVIFLTTRIVTDARIRELDPDSETMSEWYGIEMPHHYYSQRQILNRKIDYYLEVEQNREADNYKQLETLKSIVPVIYSDRYYKRLFNGNVRYGERTICNMLQLYGDNASNKVLSECVGLYNSQLDKQVKREGINGIILSMILFYFKQKEIYHKKLYLSECSLNYVISISRIVLTMLDERREEGLYLYDIFEYFSDIDESAYSLEEICKVIYALSEAGRYFWRRLLIFETKFPEKAEDLESQIESYRRQNNNKNDYSKIKICRAGSSYVEFVVPHFEFIQSRSTNATNRMRTSMSPLFCSNSLEKIDGEYRFVKKIRTVYNIVKNCCIECSNFSSRVMMARGYSKIEYINSVFNHQDNNDDGTRGIKQCYESRLIFRHITYIEKYRQYLLANKELDSNTLQEINKCLTEWIKKYLELYDVDETRISFHTEEQDTATLVLLDRIKAIEDSSYKDFTTIIETK